MFPLERQKKILELLMINKVMKITDLANELNISIETLRRDINLLAKEQKVEKVYGGIKLVETTFGESKMEVRMVSHLYEKELIARKCSEFIYDGDCIYIDSGSTTYQIAKFIKDKRNLTVITNSIPVINELMDSDVELIVIGGKIRRAEKSVISYEFLFNFNELNILKSFICASGITVEKGISDFNLEEAITRKKIIELSKEVFIAADSTKFEKDVMIGIAPLEQIDYIITDSKLERYIVNQFSDTNVQLILAQD